MLIPLHFLTRERGVLDPDGYKESIEHVVFTERLRKTLYYGKTPKKDRPSLPVTEIAVEFLQDAAPRKLGKVDVSLASHVSREACISPCSLMLGMIYVERLKHRNPDYLQQVSSSDLFLISMMMASKYLYDEGVEEEVFNDEWAESADMDVDELNTLERDFLRAIDWQLFVKPTDFFSLLERTERSIAYSKYKERGFHTYTDLMVLSQDGRLNQALQAILASISKVVVVCSVAYMAGVLTMLGASVSLVYLHQVLHVSMPPQTGLPHTSAPLLHSTPRLLVEEANTRLSGELDEKSYIPGALGGHDEPNGSLKREGLSGQRSETGLGMSGLMALALIKDTLLQFVVGVHGRDPPSSVSVTADQDDVVCTCGCCRPSVDANKQCVNVSLDDRQLFGPSWFSDLDQNLLSHVRNHETKWMTDCDEDRSRRCCCRPLDQSFPWQLWTSENSLLNVPFYNVVLGFGTTAEPMIAG